MPQRHRGHDRERRGNARRPPGRPAPGTLTLIAGRPKVGKSTLLFGLLDALRSGKPFLGFPTRKSRVLLLSEEREATLEEKRARWQIENGDVHLLMRHQAHGWKWEEVVLEATRYCRAHGIGVIVIDTADKWTGLRGDAENSAGAVNEVIQPLAFIAASGLAVVIVSHQRKSGGEHGEAVRGSNAITGAVDVVLELERVSLNLENGRSTRVLRADSRYGCTEPEVVLTLGEDGYEAQGSTEAVRENEERRRIIDALTGRTEALNAEELHQETEIAESTVRRRCQALTDDGGLLREGRGVKGDPHRWILSTSPLSLTAESNTP
jgi:predicted ATP-dependent serine protease